MKTMPIQKLEATNNNNNNKNNNNNCNPTQKEKINENVKKKEVFSI